MPEPTPTATAEAVQQIISNPEYLKLGAVAVAGIWAIAGILIAMCLWKM